VTLLTSLSLASVEFADALRLYRIFLIVLTAAFGKTGFIIGMALALISVICTPTFGGMSYFWPLFPFNGKALKSLLFRQPTSKAQPSDIWNRGPVK
jgi:stage V sporulation protein AF